jgi:AcrR family transcriptional regulator
LCIESILCCIVLLMSRERTRPTREETRRRLFEAAAAVFEDQGIGSASVEAITSAAGFTRGAFYSNFASKDELIAAMLADHVEQTVGRHLELLRQHRDAAGFVQALVSMDRSTQDPLGRSPLLHIELLLYAARTAAGKPELAEPLRARRQMVADLVRATVGNAGIDADRVGAMLLAMEDGFRLHRLIDPDTTPPDSFDRAVVELQHQLAKGS